MKTTLDEDVPHQLRQALAPRYEVSTSSFMGSSGVKSGALLKLVESGGFEAFVTGDKNLENQQQLTADAINAAKPGSAEGAHPEKPRFARV